MTDLDELIMQTAHKLSDTAAQAQRLMTGLQKAAADKSRHSIQYLQSIADVLNQSAKECLQLGPSHLNESEVPQEKLSKKKRQEKLVALIRAAIEKDEALRKECKITDKFRFVHDHLQAFSTKFAEEFAEVVDEAKSSVIVMTEDTVDVYIYLFNTQGMDMQSWRKLVHPDVFYEYSVSRPIYTEKEHVEKYIASRPTRSQHAYITIAISKSLILPPNEDRAKDAIGNPLVRIQEGKLKITQVRSFKHNLIEYNVSPSGVLSKKE